MTYQVVIILGSQSDQQKVQDSKMLAVLEEVRVSWELSVISAHRNPEELDLHVNRRSAEGTPVFIGIAGMAAALPGQIAAILQGRKPVLGVALSSSPLNGLAALLAEVCMPPGRPVMVCGSDEAGLYNAAQAACSIVALYHHEVRLRFNDFLERATKKPAIGLLASDKKSGA